MTDHDAHLPTATAPAGGDRVMPTAFEPDEGAIRELPCGMCEQCGHMIRAAENRAGGPPGHRKIGSHTTQPCLSADTLPSATIRPRQDRRQHPPRSSWTGATSHTGPGGHEPEPDSTRKVMGMTGATKLRLKTGDLAKWPSPTGVSMCGPAVTVCLIRSQTDHVRFLHQQEQAHVLTSAGSASHQTRDLEPHGACLSTNLSTSDGGFLLWWTAWSRTPPLGSSTPTASFLSSPLLPSFNSRPQGGGTAPLAERAVFTAAVYVLNSGCAWRHLPGTFGVSPATAHRRFTAWTEAGL